MRGRMPFLLRFLAPVITAAIEKDYEIGLILLRARLDPNADRLQIRFIGETEHPAQIAMTIPFSGCRGALPSSLQW